MNSLTAKELKSITRQRLAAAQYPPRKLTFLYSGITLGLSFLSVVLSWVTGLMMDSTGGLSGLGTRAILDTVSMVFSIAVQIITPLLAMGFTHCCIRIVRQNDLRPKHLTMGPRRWAVILRHGLLVGAIFLVLAYLALQIASIAFMFSSNWEHAMELMYGLMDDPAFMEGTVPMSTMTEMIRVFMPVYIISAVLILVTFIPVSYRLRLSTYRILEEAPVGAARAVLESNKLMKKHCVSLFKLDLSFWWFYVLQAIPGLALYGIPLLIPLSDGWYVALCGVYSLAILVLQYYFFAYVQTTYAMFYQHMLETAVTPAQPQIEE